MSEILPMLSAPAVMTVAAPAKCHRPLGASDCGVGWSESERRGGVGRAITVPGSHWPMMNDQSIPDDRDVARLCSKPKAKIGSIGGREFEVTEPSRHSGKVNNIVIRSPCDNDRLLRNRRDDQRVVDVGQRYSYVIVTAAGQRDEKASSQSTSRTSGLSTFSSAHLVNFVVYLCSSHQSQMHE